MQWKPIESAPKDGTKVLLWDRLGAASARWTDGLWIVGKVDGVDLIVRAPSHWMPLPDPPTDEFITLPRMEME